MGMEGVGRSRSIARLCGEGRVGGVVVVVAAE